MSLPDPLQQILDAVQGSDDGCQTLCALYASSADVRACLRLVDAAYFDALSAAARVSRQDANPARGMGAVGTRMARELLALALANGPDSETAAAILADMVDSSALLAESLDFRPISDALLARVASLSQQEEGVGAHTRLLLMLCADNQITRAALADIAQAVGTIVQAADNVHAAGPVAQRLALAAQLARARGVAPAPPRVFARRVIALLGAAAPRVSAAALHVLTLLVLGPELGDGLRGKLFDAAHMPRTLELAADLCLNCGHSPAVPGDDLRVLDSVAGVVAALAGAQGPQLARVRAAFFESTALAPALAHVAALARTDRRYVHALLRMAGAVVASPEDAATPLVRALVGSSEPPSVLADAFDLVLSGIEDVACTVPFIAGSGAPRWPRVAGDEAGCGWLINCPAACRRDVAGFLRAALLASGEDGPWAGELMLAVAHAIGPPAQLLAAGSAESAAAVGRYYWAVRPVARLAADLAAVSPAFDCCWQQWLASAEDSPLSWAAAMLAQTVTSSDGSGLGGEALHCDIAAAFAPPELFEVEALLLGNRQTVQKAGAAVAATPSDSSHSSPGSASPHAERNVIALTDIRAAAAANVSVAADSVASPITPCSINGGQGLGISAHPLSSNDTAARLQSAVLRQWLRTCQLELALLLANSAKDPNAVVPLDVLQRIPSVIQQSRLLVVEPTPLVATNDLLLQNSSGPTNLLGGIATASALRLRYSAQIAELQPAYTQRLQQSYEKLADSEEELAHVNAELHRSRAHAEQLTAELGRKHTYAERLTADHSDLTDAHAELQSKMRRIETDTVEWKQECLRTRDLLETSEAMARDARQRLLQATELQHAAQLAFDAKQRVWDQKQASMADSAAALELALADAVPRLRALEAQAEIDRRRNADLSEQNSTMAAKLADLAQAAN
ncbi:hypothetical protein H4R26_002357, partial [Coemansia thaxteri]